MREKIQDALQGEYWDSISDAYHHTTRISCSDFHYGPQIPGESGLHLLPEFKPGMTALELGCGGAQNSIWLAQQGVECTAMDISDTQLSHAGELAIKRSVSIRLIQGTLEGFKEHLGEETFDLVHSSHAMEFVEYPADVVRDMVSCLKKGGTLMISTVHPLYNGDWICGEYDEDEACEDALGDGLFLKNYFEPPDDVRDESGVHVVSRAHPVSSWFKWLRAAGLDVLSIEEPAAIENAPYTSDDWANHDGELDAIPSTVIFVARLPK